MTRNDQLLDEARKGFMVHPCIMDGRQTLVYERGLEKLDPQTFLHLTKYANENGYIIREDRRADFIEGVKRVKDPSRANVITILVLTASILSQSAVAGPANYLGMTEPVSAVEQMQVYSNPSFEMSSYNTIEDLMGGLVNWINSHTSLKHDTDNLPELVFANPNIIAEVAFGGELPSNVDAAKLNILGLYNFNDQTIYMLDSLDLKTDEGKAILLHELVHYLQYEESLNDNVECKNELEALAYTLEAEYLNGQGVKHSISQNHIKNVSTCKQPKL
jgi:hypothetical protein